MPGRPAPFRALRGRSDQPALEGFKDEGFVRLDDSAQLSRLVGRRSAQKPMPPAKRRRRMHPAKLGRTWPGFCLRSSPDGRASNQRSLSASAIAVLVSRIEGAPATLAAEPRKRSASPQATMARPAQCGQPWLRHSAARLLVPKASGRRPRSRAFVPSPPPPRRSESLPPPPEPAIQIRQSGGHSRRCSTLSRPTPENQETENSSAFIRYQAFLKPAPA